MLPELSARNLHRLRMVMAKAEAVGKVYKEVTVFGWKNFQSN